MDDQLIGQIVAGRYRIIAKMGEGGMGTVYRAEHVAIGKQLALKVLLLEYARKPDLKERFLREAKAAAAIGHENIVDITDFGDTPDGSVFFAMEYLDGHDLGHHIKQGGAMPWSRAKPILLQICRALGAAHSKQIVHRDMKPENIFLIEREGRPDFVKVLDFGIAKVSGSTDGEHRLTRTGMIFGTPEYMSPEQAQGHSPDHRVDIYAVGVIMYELLTGEVPFKADTFMGILTKHIFEEPTPPSLAAPGAIFPPEAEEIVLKALKKDRNERFQSMSEMATALSQVSARFTRATGETPAPPRVLSPSRPRIAPESGPAWAQTTMPNGTQTDFSADEVALVPRWRIGTVLGLVAAAVGLGVGLVLLLKPASSVAPPEKAAAVGSSSTAQGTDHEDLVRVRVDSEPAGARVLKGIVTLGQTPLETVLPKSKLAVMLTFRLDGYAERREPVVPDHDGVALRVVLARQVTDAKAVVAGEALHAADSKAAASRASSAKQRSTAKSSRRHYERSHRAKATTTTPSRGQRRKPPMRVEDLMNPFE